MESGGKGGGEGGGGFEERVLRLSSGGHIRPP